MEPLLLINGYAATGADWDPTFRAELDHSFRVISPGFVAQALAARAPQRVSDLAQEPSRVAGAIRELVS